MLFIKSKIQFFESKSQHDPSTKYHSVVVYQVKDTIFWKQITTSGSASWNDEKLFIKSKIQFFESKSQHAMIAAKTPACCLSSQRYNFLKANHNKLKRLETAISVVYQVKDTIFWKQITTYF